VLSIVVKPIPLKPSPWSHVIGGMAGSTVRSMKVRRNLQPRNPVKPTLVIGSSGRSGGRGSRDDYDYLSAKGFSLNMHCFRDAERGLWSSSMSRTKDVSISKKCRNRETRLRRSSRKLFCELPLALCVKKDFSLHEAVMGRKRRVEAKQLAKVVPGINMALRQGKSRWNAVQRSCGRNTQTAVSTKRWLELIFRSQRARAKTEVKWLPFGDGILGGLNASRLMNPGGWRVLTGPLIMYGTRNRYGGYNEYGKRVLQVRSEGLMKRGSASDFFSGRYERANPASLFHLKRSRKSNLS